MGLGTSNNNHLPLESPTFKKNPPSTINAHTPPSTFSHQRLGGGEDIRPNRIPSHAPDLGDVFEAAGGGERMGMGMGLQVLA